MRVPLPDGSVRELPDGSTGADLAADIGPGLARAAMAIRVLDGDRTEKRDGTAYDDGRIRDLAVPLVDGEAVEIVTAKAGDGDALKLLRHDVAHVLAESVLELYPGTKVSIGPPIADGFYYDFEFPDGVSINEGDFERIEAQMRKHIKAGEPFERSEVAVGEAIERYLKEDQPYKVELIEDLVKNQGVETVSLYRNGEFLDLCRGPHAPDTGRAKAYKLTSVAGAYWRGDANRQMLTRIYGTAFASKDELAEHLERLEQARARDHRKLGRELELFMFSEFSPGSPFWFPNGMAIWNELTDLWRTENSARGYREVHTPILYNAEIFKQSGHWHVYRDNMYFTDVEGESMGLKPMNCPAHTQLYASRDARTATSRSATPSRASSIATSRPARSTACCACGTSRRTTRTSSPPRTRSRKRSSAASTSASRSTSGSGSSRGWSSPPGPRSGSAPRTCGTAPRRRCSARWRTTTWRTSSTRATARSTGRRSTST